jgi:hypothetical protein
VDSNFSVTPHPDPWVDLSRPYVAEVVATLARGGLRIRRSWLDPRDPRDATIVWAEGDGSLVGLVWDEETGWRRGRFVSGRQGLRTVLGGTIHLGGGVLPAPADVARRAVSGEGGPRRQYRSWLDLHDGFDDALRVAGRAVLV